MEVVSLSTAAVSVTKSVASTEPAVVAAITLAHRLGSVTAASGQRTRSKQCNSQKCKTLSKHGSLLSTMQSFDMRNGLETTEFLPVRAAREWPTRWSFASRGQFFSNQSLMTETTHRHLYSALVAIASVRSKLEQIQAG